MTTRRKVASRCSGFTLIEMLVVIAILAVLSAVLTPVYLGSRRAAYGSVCLANLHQIHGALALYLQDSDEQFPRVDFSDGVGGTFAITLDRDLQERQVRDDPFSLQNVMSRFIPSRAVFRCPADRGAILPQDALQDKDPSFHDLHISSIRITTDRTGTPLYDRFGSSYRPAYEVGTLELALSDISSPASIFWASDISGQWHTKDPGGPASAAAPNGESRWQMNAVFVDGHAATVSYARDLWDPYTAFIRAEWKARF